MPTSEGTGGRKSRTLAVFVTGLAIGVAGTIVLPRFLNPYLPNSLRSDQVEVAGLVTAKERQPERLLLTVDSDAGALLVTYTDRVPEIDLLVEKGDTVTLAIREYMPFAENPRIRRVEKVPAGAAAAGPAAAGTEAGVQAPVGAPGAAAAGADTQKGGAPQRGAPTTPDTGRASPEAPPRDTSALPQGQGEEPVSGGSRDSR